MKSYAYDLAGQQVDVGASRLPGPVLTYIGGRNWRLEADYVYNSEGTRITVPAGFIFDLSSVPRVLWWLIAPFELSVTAPLLHDFLYRYGGQPPPGAVEPPRRYTRRAVDELFRDVMEQEGVTPWRRSLGFVAVRAFGYWAWRRDHVERAQLAEPG